MRTSQKIDIEIDKLTRSIENAITGDSFKTEILPLTLSDLKQLNKTDWSFDWKAEAKNKDKLLYKLTIVGNPTVLQGLVSCKTEAIIFLCILLKAVSLIVAQEKFILEFLVILLHTPAGYHLRKVMMDMYHLKAKPNLLNIIDKH